MDNTTTLPTTADSGYNYGAGIIDLFKFGVGAYYNNQNQTAMFDAKARYDSINGTLYQNGQAANPLTPTGQQNYMPLIIGAGVILAIVLLVK